MYFVLNCISKGYKTAKKARSPYRSQALEHIQYEEIKGFFYKKKEKLTAQKEIVPEFI